MKYKQRSSCRDYIDSQNFCRYFYFRNSLFELRWNQRKKHRAVELWQNLSRFNYEKGGRYSPPETFSLSHNKFPAINKQASPEGVFHVCSFWRSSHFGWNTLRPRDTRRTARRRSECGRGASQTGAQRRVNSRRRCKAPSVRKNY